MEQSFENEIHMMYLWMKKDGSWTLPEPEENASVQTKGSRNP